MGLILFKCPEKKRQERIEIGKKYKGTHCDFHAVLFFLHTDCFHPKANKLHHTMYLEQMKFVNV